MSNNVMPKYQIDMGFRTRVKCLAALAFIPVSDLVVAYEGLSTTILADEIPILPYFEFTWNRMGDRGWSWRTKKRSCLPPPGIPPHPSIWTLLDSLKRQQALTLNTISEIQRGKTFQLYNYMQRRDEKRPDHEDRFSILSSKCRRNSAWKSL